MSKLAPFKKSVKVLDYLNERYDESGVLRKDNYVRLLDEMRKAAKFKRPSIKPGQMNLFDFKEEEPELPRSVPTAQRTPLSDTDRAGLVQRLKEDGVSISRGRPDTSGRVFATPLSDNDKNKILGRLKDKTPERAPEIDPVWTLPTVEGPANPSVKVLPVSERAANVERTKKQGRVPSAVRPIKEVEVKAPAVVEAIKEQPSVKMDDVDDTGTKKDAFLKRVEGGDYPIKGSLQWHGDPVKDYWNNRVMSMFDNAVDRQKNMLDAPEMQRYVSSILERVNKIESASDYFKFVAGDKYRFNEKSPEEQSDIKQKRQEQREHRDEFSAARGNVKTHLINSFNKHQPISKDFKEDFFEDLTEVLKIDNLDNYQFVGVLLDGIKNAKEGLPLKDMIQNAGKALYPFLGDVDEPPANREQEIARSEAMGFNTMLWNNYRLSLGFSHSNFKSPEGRMKIKRMYEPKSIAKTRYKIVDVL